MSQAQNDQSKEKPSHWVEDNQERWQQAAFLTNFVGAEYERLVRRSNREEAGSAQRKLRHFVLNIDSPWGYGKTFFLERWKTDLEKADHLVLTFNAWENDFSKDPLLSFLSEISSQLVQKLKQDSEANDGTKAPSNAVNFVKLKNKSVALLKNYGPQLALRAGFTLASGIPAIWPSSSGVDTDSEAEEKDPAASLDSLSQNQLNNLFEEQTARKRALEEFREELTALVQSIKEHMNAYNEAYKLPIFILIDELDRCRPDFTIELIEMVKHIFSVDDIFFVFATDGKQLQASLAGVYGDGFDAELYFKRIFSREMQLKRPNNEQFVDALIREYEIFGDPSSMDWLIYVTEGRPSETKLDKFIIEFKWVADAFALTLRDQHQLAASFASVFLYRQAQREKTCTVITLILLVLWQKRKELFESLMQRPQEFEELQSVKSLRQSFPSLDMRATLDTGKYSRESADGLMTVPDALVAFAKLSDLSHADLKQKAESGHLGEGWAHEMALDTFQAAPVRGGAQLPLQRYFDQIMMAG